MEHEEAEVQVERRKVVPELVQSVTEQISLAASEGFLLVYTDRSSLTYTDGSALSPGSRRELRGLPPF